MGGWAVEDDLRRGTVEDALRIADWRLQICNIANLQSSICNLKSSVPRSQVVARLPREGVDNTQPFEPMEIAIAGDQLGDAMLEAQRGDVCVMDQIAGRSRRPDDCVQHVGVPGP